jgi:hypothetical protein
MQTVVILHAKVKEFSKAIETKSELSCLPIPIERFSFKSKQKCIDLFCLHLFLFLITANNYVIHVSLSNPSRKYKSKVFKVLNLWSCSNEWDLNKVELIGGICSCTFFILYKLRFILWQNLTSNDNFFAKVENNFVKMRQFLKIFFGLIFKYFIIYPNWK